MRTSLVLSIFIALAAGGAAAAPPQPGTSETPSESLAALSASFEALAQRVAPSVVEIFTNGYTVGPGQPNVLARQQGSGSGVVLDTEGHIVTNAHVVAGARRIQVLLPVLEDDPGGRSGGVKPRPGKVDAHLVALDSATDLAVLKIAEAGLHPLPFGDSDKLRQGQLVLAFGSPLGLGSTVTLGVVSAVARQLGPDDTMVYVQTDAPINPGNSGGPLVDTQGQAVGLNTMIMTQSGGSEGIGLAIPSNTVRAIAEQLLRSGRVRRGVIGVQVQAVTPVMAAAMHLTQAWGVIVSDMLDSGPAAKAGVQVGDLVVSAGGRAVEGVAQFGAAVHQHRIGVPIAIGVVRGSQRLTFNPDVIERQDDINRFLELVDPDRNLVPPLDILGLEVTEKLLDALPELRIRSGVLVVAVSPDAAPPGDRFQPGDVIHGINGSSVATLGELRAALAALNDGDPLVVQIERDGRLSFVAFEVD